MLKERKIIRGLALLLCLSLMVGMLPIGAIAVPVTRSDSPTPSANLVANGDFEASDTEYSGWSKSGNQSASVVTGIGYNGTNALKMDDIATNGGVEMLSDEFAVTAGEEYTFSFWIKRDESGMAEYNLGYFIFFYTEQGADKNAFINTYVDGKASSSKDEWRQVTRTFTVPENVVAARIRFGFDRNHQNCVLLDNVSVTGNSSSPAPTESTPTEATVPPITDEGILNSDFEASNTQLVGWHQVSGATASLAVGEGRNNSNALKLDDPVADKGLEVKSDNFSVNPGYKQSLSFWIKQYDPDADAGHNLSMYLFFFTETGAVASTEYVEFRSTPATPEWVNFVREFDVPADATQAYIRMNFSRSQQNCVLVDDFRLATVSDGPVEPTEPTDATEPTPPLQIIVPDGLKVFEDTFENEATPDDASSKVHTPVGWTPSPNSGAAIGIAKYDKFDGTTNLCIQNAKNKWIKSSLVDAVPGYQYTISFVEKKYVTDVVGNGGYAKIVFVDADGNILKEYASVAGVSKTWTQKLFYGKAPANAVSFYIEFGLFNPAGEPTYSVDNLAVYAVEANLNDPLPSIPDDQIPSFVPTIFNGSFDAGLDGWGGRSLAGATATIVTEGAYNGKSLLLTAKSTETEKASNVYYQKFEIVGLTAVELSIVSKAANAESKGSAYIGLWFYDKDGNLTPTNTAFTMNIGTTTEWKKTTLIQAVPADAVSVTVEFGNPSGQENLAYMVDDISFLPYDGPADEIRPAEPATPSGGSAIVDPSKLNGSVEKFDVNGEPIGWRPRGIAIFKVVEAADAPDGKYVYEFTKNLKGGQLRSARIACVPGKTYELKVMVKDLENNCILSFMVYDKDGNRLDDACKAVYTDGSGKWRMYSILATMPENAAGVELEVWGASESLFTVQVDALSIEISNEEVKPPYVPTPYTYPTVEELTANLTDVYPRIFFTPEEAKAIKLRRFDMLKTKYGWTWNKQYTDLLDAADAYMETKELRVGMGGGFFTFSIDPVPQNPNDPDLIPLYIQNSTDENGVLRDNPYTGFGALYMEPLAAMLKTWSLAYIMTGKDKYAEKAISFAMEISTWRGWTDQNWLDAMGVASEASVSWMMQGMVAVFDMCHDKMTPEQIKQLERSIIEQGLVPMSKHIDPMSTHNGNLMQVGGILSGAAAILNKENAEEIYPYLQAGLLAMHNALDNYAYSGNTEGHYYTSFGLETFMPGIGHFYRATKMDGIIDHYFFTDILPYWTIMWGANESGAHPNYSDGSSRAYMKIPMGVLSKLTNDPLIDGFLINAGGAGGAFENLIYLNPDPKPEYLTDHAGVIEEFGYGALRTGFANDDMLLTLKANDSQMGHNHYDQNSILFSIGGNWLIADPGAGSYYYADRTFWTHNGHSNILVDGRAQSVMGTGSTKLVFNNNLYSYIVGSAPKAYGKDIDSVMLEKFDRHAIQVNHEDKGYYVIIDDLLAPKPREYSWQMYNGARKTFSVDEVDVPEQGSAMGNRVSMPLGKNVLNLNFIDSDKLTIADKIWKSAGKNAGLTLTATTAATKAHQFMTVISSDSNSLSTTVNFHDILGDLRSTLSESIREGEISWDSSMPTGQEILKPNMIGTSLCVFFRGNKVGDWIEFPFTVDETGVYEMTLVMGVSDGCCQVKATLDGKIESEIFDCSGLPEDFLDISFGELELEKGTHTMRLEVAGPGLDEDYADGWYLINAGGIDLMRSGVQIPPANDLVVTEVIDNEEALAGMINYKDNKFDFLMWNRTEGAATAGKLNTDAQQASVLGIVDGASTEGFAATKATTLVYDGKVLFLAEKDVDIVASSTGWQITSAEAQTVQLTAIAPELDYVVTVNGEAVDAKIENGLLTLAIEAGETKIALDVEEPVVEDPTQPTETEPSEPAQTDPTVAPTEPAPVEDGNDATLWIIIGVIVVLLAAAATFIVLFMKKRKAAN